MTQPTQFKTRTDGSVDAAHYMARGRKMRSAAFHAALGKLRRLFAGRAQAAAPKRPSIRPVRGDAVLHPGE